MNGKISVSIGIGIAATLACLVGASPASAQQGLDTKSIPQPSVQAASCAQVAWNKDLLAQFPRIGEGCQEVVVSDGKKWARFAADFVQRNRDGSVTFEFQDRRGRSMGELALMPAPDQRVAIGGHDYRFSELSRGQELNLYVPEQMYAVASEPGAPPGQLAQIVKEPVQVAQAEPDRTPERLPKTAGPLPPLALGGVASLLAGLVLTIRRRIRARLTGS